MNKKNKPHIMWLWVAVIAVSVILDQVTKLIVVKNMELYETAPFYQRNNRISVYRKPRRGLGHAQR